MEISLAKANDQTKASLGYLFASYYMQMSNQGGHDCASYTSKTSQAQTTRLTAIHDMFIVPFVQFSGLYLPGLDRLQACLSIDPETGALEPEGLSIVAKVHMHTDTAMGRNFLAGNEAGGVEGALKRAERFKKLVEERVATTEDEMKLLSWLYEDPLCGRSLEEWLWTVERVEMTEEETEGEGEEEEGGEGKIKLVWGTQGQGTNIVSLGDLVTVTARAWLMSLSFFSLALTMIWSREAVRFMRAGGEP